MRKRGTKNEEKFGVTNIGNVFVHDKTGAARRCALFVKIERPILVSGTRYMSFESLSPTFFHLFNSLAFRKKKRFEGI